VFGIVFRNKAAEPDKTNMFFGKFSPSILSKKNPRGIFYSEIKNQILVLNLSFIFGHI